MGEALGRSEEAEELLADLDAEIAQQAEAHPELAGKTVAMVWNTADEFYVYKPADARVAFTLDLGLESAPASRSWPAAARPSTTPSATSGSPS